MRTSSNNSYCDFSENKTIEFLPEEWGLRWSILAFKVNMFMFLFLTPITKSYMLKIFMNNYIYCAITNL